MIEITSDELLHIELICFFSGGIITCAIALTLAQFNQWRAKRKDKQLVKSIFFRDAVQPRRNEYSGDDFIN